MEGYAVKAVGDWELDVLSIPYGGPVNGKDAQGEYFSERTELRLDAYKDQPVFYFHGWDDAEAKANPEPIGRVTGNERRSDGVWSRVVLDKASKFAARIWDAAKKGLARASSDSIAHLVRTSPDGEILNWPFAALSLLDAVDGRQPVNGFAVALPAMKAIYQSIGRDLPEQTTPEGNKMTEELDIHKTVADAVKAALDFERKENEARAERERAAKAQVDEAVKAVRDEYEAKLNEANRPASAAKAPAVNLHGDINKYDNLSAPELAFALQVQDNVVRSRGGARISDAAVKALAMRLESDETAKTTGGRDAVKALRSKVGDAVKAYEINYSTYASYGDEWVGVLYHTDLWEKIRAESWIMRELESKGDVRQIGDGFESDVVPLESTDPIWYKVAQAAAHDATSGRPVATITSSNIGTAQKAVTLSKMGCRVIYSGEMVEDSLIRWVPNAYRQIQVSGQEMMEYILIDGDTSSANTTNINDIGAQPAGNEAFTIQDGFRKLALVTNTANSRDGGVLTVEDYLETLKLMGNAGKNGADPQKVSFIVDPWTYWKTLELDEVKTRDVFGMPTLENGMLTGLWGYPLKRSFFMHYSGVIQAEVTTAAYMNKANSAGKVDMTTEANNTKGAILAVRWDQWALRWKRRMTLEVGRWPEADASQIVAIARWGLGYRDTEAASITYNLTV